MKGKPNSEKQIIGGLIEYETGMSAQDVIRKYSVANATFYRWKFKGGGMEVSKIERFREPRVGNVQLMKLPIGSHQSLPRKEFHHLLDGLNLELLWTSFAAHKSPLRLPF